MSEGLFRISCSNASLLELRDKLERDGIVFVCLFVCCQSIINDINDFGVDDVDFSKFEVHVVTSAMKLFFREMPGMCARYIFYIY